MKNKTMLLILTVSLFISCGSLTQPKGEISLSKSEIRMEVNKTDTITVKVEPASIEEVVWTIDDERIATVFYGVVKAKLPGTCTLTVTCGELTAACPITVVPAGIDPNDTTTIDDVEGYTLMWSDEFNGNALNRSIWNIEVNGSGGGNNELQYYSDRPENVSMETHPITGEKCVVLTAKKETYNGRACTSGRINTKNNLAFTHGMIEARINIPLTANGLWPAFWMMGNDYDQVGWPKCGEIDIMEMGNRNGINRGTQDRYYSAWFHWGPSYSGGNYPNAGHDATSSYPIQNSFHTFRFYWDGNNAQMFLDKDIYPSVQPYCTMNISDASNANAPGTYFHKPFFILFNLAIGGNFMGINNINDITALNEGNNFTAKYYIDYVRVYQRGMPNETFEIFE
jgi:beta-glucanase (GH16 family)